MCVCFACNVGVVYVRYSIGMFVVWVSDLKSVGIFPMIMKGNTYLYLYFYAMKYTHIQLNWCNTFSIHVHVVT